MFLPSGNYLLDKKWSKVGPAGFEPATKRLCIPPRLSPPLSGLWAGLSFHPFRNGCLPSSLYTFPAARAWLGIALPCGEGFPEFDRYHLEITPQAALLQRVLSRYNAVMKDISNCVVCGSRLTGRQTKFCSPACKNKDLQSYEAQKRRGLAKKLEIVVSAGGCCSICGYHQNLAALVFHHIDSSSKDFKLDMRSLSNRKLDPVLAEIDKCILVCANCHAELHNPHLNLDSLL